MEALILLGILVAVQMISFKDGQSSGVRKGIHIQRGINLIEGYKRKTSSDKELLEQFEWDVEEYKKWEKYQGLRLIVLFGGFILVLGSLFY